MPAAYTGLGSLKLEYDANMNPRIFEQLCQLDLKQVINQVSYYMMSGATCTLAPCSVQYPICLTHSKHMRLCPAYSGRSLVLILLICVGSLISVALACVSCLFCTARYEVQNTGKSSNLFDFRAKLC